MLGGSFGRLSCAHIGIAICPKAVSTADLEVPDTLLVSANGSGTFQKSWNELLTFLEYVNLGLLAKEEGSKY